MNPQILVRTYHGSETEAAAAFQRDAITMSQHGYYPVSQNWTQGSYGCGEFLVALLLCFLCVGILIFFYLLIVPPPGTLIVTYQYRLAQPPPLPLLE
jgi:hypothetical protein